MQHQVVNDILIPEMERMLNEGREVLFTPSGVSMRPFIEGGRDSVVLRRPSAPIRRGDILLARYIRPDESETYVLHRVLRVEKDGTVVLQRGTDTAGECAGYRHPHPVARRTPQTHVPRTAVASAYARASLATQDLQA